MLSSVWPSATGALPAGAQVRVDQAEGKEGYRVTVHVEGAGRVPLGSAAAVELHW